MKVKRLPVGPWLPLWAAAELLGSVMSHERLRRMASMEAIRSRRMVSQWYVHRDDVQRYLASETFADGVDRKFLRAWARRKKGLTNA